MVVRKTERVREMAGEAGAMERGTRRGPVGRAFGRGWCSVAGAVLGALAMAATAGPAAGQGTSYAYQRYTLPDHPHDHRPLAVAYLAAPYPDKDNLKGPATIALQGGDSVYVGFLEPKGRGWKGIPIGFFDRPLFDQQTRFAKGDNKLVVGGRGTPLDVKLYFFMEEPLVSTLKIRAYSSDDWARNKSSGSFALLSDTTFVIQGQGLVGFEEKEIACINKRTADPKCEVSKDAITGEVEVTGEIIEDPLSGAPALFMKARKALGGPPSSWLKEVPTEICVEKLKMHVIRLPKHREQIPLDRKVGDRWCSPAGLKVDYLALREEGLRLGSFAAKKRLDSQSASDSDWRMWAEPPYSAVVGDTEVWVQRIVLHPPSEAVEASQRPLVLPQSPDAIFKVKVSGQLSAEQIKQLWYRPLPAGSDANTQCTIPPSSKTSIKAAEVSVELGHLVVKQPEKSQLNLRENLDLIADAGGRAFCGVAKLVSERLFEVELKAQSSTETAASGKGQVPPKDKTSPPRVAQKPGPLVSVAFISDLDKDELVNKLTHDGKASAQGFFFEKVDSHNLRFALPPDSNYRIASCDRRLPPELECKPDPDGQGLAIKPRRAGAVPSLIRVTVTFALRDISLTFQVDGPAAVRIQKLSGGKLTDLLKKLEGRSGEPVTISSWRTGDKVKVSLYDGQDIPYKVTKATLDLGPVPTSDKEFELEIGMDLNGKAVSITTEDRPYSGTVSVTTRGGGIDIWLGSKKIDSVQVGAKKNVEVRGAKYNDVLAVTAKDDELEVASLRLSGPAGPLSPVGEASFSLERYVGPRDKLALSSLEAVLREIPLKLPAEVLLKPAVRLGKQLLPLRSCKVLLTGSDGTRIETSQPKDDTLVKFGPNKTAPRKDKYAVEFQGEARICRELVAEGPLKAAELTKPRSDGTVPVPARYPDGRAFVGIVDLPEKLRSEPENWVAAVAALGAAYDAGAQEGRYIWAAIYGPDGSVLAKRKDADYDSIEHRVSDIFKKDSTMERLIEGRGVRGLNALLQLAGKDVGDFEGNVDMLVVAPAVTALCGWTGPRGSGHAALVRLADTSIKEGSKEVPGMIGVRLCDKVEPGVTAELEVVPVGWKAGVTPKTQLERAIKEAASSLKK